MAGYDHQGHRVRLKNRFLKEGGFENFEEHNILELLLFYTIPRKDTNEIAHRILDRFGSLASVIDAPYEELIKCEGVSKNTACLLKAVLPLARAYNKSKYDNECILTDHSMVSEYLLGKYIGLDEEMLSVISLDNRFALLSFDIIARGTLDSVIIDMRKVVKMLINNKAASAIIAHNHPSGFALPSTDDLMQTRNLVIACGSIGIKVIDHILIAENECISLSCSPSYKSLFSGYNINIQG